MNVLPFPIWDSNSLSITSGVLFPVPKICKIFNKQKCVGHYNKISLAKGFHKCPCGLSSFSNGTTHQPIITGIRVAGYYDNKKLKRMVEDYLPTFPSNFILASLSSLYENNKKHDIDLINSSLHEIRKLNSEIKRLSEELMLGRAFTDEDYKKKYKSIFASSSLISVRLNIYDFEKNPNIVTSASRYDASIYGKFEKAAHVLEVYAKDRGVKVESFIGKSYRSTAIYPAFDFLPYVLLENAIKYSPKDYVVNVEFTKKENKLLVAVKSIGPRMNEEELKYIFTKGIRGANAKKLDSSGGGYGLYFAKLICDLHEIDIEVIVSDEKYRINDIPYSNVSVNLLFKNCT